MVGSVFLYPKHNAVAKLSEAITPPQPKTTTNNFFLWQEQKKWTNPMIQVSHESLDSQDLDDRGSSITVKSHNRISTLAKPP